MIFVTSKDRMPTQRHYVILEFSSITIPGDERSRTNPGHGYPEHSETTVSYICTLDRNEWIAEIERREKNIYGRSNYVAFESTPVMVKRRVDVEVSKK